MEELLILHGLGQPDWQIKNLKINRHQKTIVPKIPWKGNADQFYRSVAIIDSIIRNASGETPIIGISAGASLAILLASKYPDKIKKIVTICGRVRKEPNTLISTFFHSRKPWQNYLEIVDMAEDILKHKEKLIPYTRFLLLTAIFDGITPYESAIIPNAEMEKSLLPGHILGCACIPRIKFRRIANFLKN